MRLPGFTAEAALVRTSGGYHWTAENDFESEYFRNSRSLNALCVPTVATTATSISRFLERTSVGL